MPILTAQQDCIHALECLSEFACLCRICFWAKCKNMIFLIYLHEDPQLEAIFSVPNPKAGYILSVSFAIVSPWCESLVRSPGDVWTRSRAESSPLFPVHVWDRLSQMWQSYPSNGSEVKCEAGLEKIWANLNGHLSSFTSPACLRLFINISSAQKRVCRWLYIIV